jgi:hypothetical protein
VDYLAHLDAEIRDIAICCYTVAFRAAFGAFIGVAGFAVLSAALGIGAQPGGSDKEELTEQPPRDYVPVLE